MILNKSNEKAILQPTDIADDGERSITKEPTYNPGATTTINAANAGVHFFVDMDCAQE